MPTEVQLYYSLDTDPFPLEASDPDPDPQGQLPPLSTATLTLEALNQSGDPVSLNAITVTIPTGDDGGDLTPANQATSIIPVSPANWKPATPSRLCQVHVRA